MWGSQNPTLWEKRSCPPADTASCHRAADVAAVAVVGGVGIGGSGSDAIHNRGRPYQLNQHQLHQLLDPRSDMHSALTLHQLLDPQ